MLETVKAGLQAMISYEEALKILREAGARRRLSTEFLPIGLCVGRICAQNLKAPLDIQPFDNSAMDGFAVRLGDLKDDGGVLIKAGMIAAGDPVPEKSMEIGTCVQIMTGAPVPPGAEAVVPVELVEMCGDEVLFKACPKKGENIRRAGEDFHSGMDVLTTGQRMGPQYVLPLATLGVDKGMVYKKPRAVFLATGNELVDDLSQDLKSGQIYNSNRPYGLAALAAMGVECADAPSMPDDPAIFQKFLKNLEEKNVDIIISSGAVSAGKFDFVRAGLEKAGAEILFHKVKIKPGKPNLFARLPDGTLYFGLPGNPVATAAGLRFFVQPCLRAMMGMGEEKPAYAKVMTPFKKRAGLKMFLKARAESWEDGLLTVDLLDGQESFMVRPFLGMNCWAVIPDDREEIKASDVVGVHSLYPHEGIL